MAELINNGLPDNGRSVSLGRNENSVLVCSENANRQNGEHTLLLFCARKKWKWGGDKMKASNLTFICELYYLQYKIKKEINKVK